MLGDLPARSGDGQLHGPQPVPGSAAQQLQLRGAQVKEGGRQGIEEG